MITVRKAEDRGRTRMGWLDSWHSFSFGGYYDPENDGFRALRVINDDIIAPGGGFGTHPHRDMEILTWVLDGGLAHRDSTGTEAVLKPGMIQRMSAGSGITHSEYNASKQEPLRLLQIWLFPERNGLKPSYEEKTFTAEERTGQLRLVAAPGAPDGAVDIHQDAALLVGTLRPGDEVRHELKSGRHAWVQVAKGAVTVNGVSLQEGDAVALSEEPDVEIRADSEGEVLVFDLA
jgi:redox-sensitive bicupin YhaK (pirin superfamily)